MIVRHLVVGMFQENSYLAVCEETREAVFIDPGDEAERLAALVEELGATPVRILNTHAHLDHVGAVADLKERFGSPSRSTKARGGTSTISSPRRGRSGSPAFPRPRWTSGSRRGGSSSSAPSG